MTNILKFNSHSKDYGFLSNFYEKKDLLFLKHKSKKIFFNSVEAAFQAVKILYINIDNNDLFSNSNKNSEDSDLVLSYYYKFATLSPLQAKKQGKQLKNLDLLKWNNDKIFVMNELLLRKFSNKDLKELLISTKPYQLVEYNTGTDFWGMIDKNGNLFGENHLGKLLMDVRERL